MGSTGTERSLGSGLIPQWMKNKVDVKMDLDEHAFSPPSIDDSFFFIRYKREDDNTTSTTNSNMANITTRTSAIKLSAASGSDNGYRPITELIKQENIVPIDKKVPKFNKHTVPCQQYLAQTQQIGVTPDIPKSKQSTPGVVRVKSAGTDDGFKGEGAACGTSIIQVASQMVSGKSLRGFHQTSLDGECPSNNVHPDSPPQTSSSIPQGFDPFARRGSKSLPTTPLTSPNSSPKSRRKLHNRYFTGAFVDNVERYQGSWILSGLLGTREVLSRSANTISEEECTSTSQIDTFSKSTSKVEVNNVNMEAPDTPPESITDTKKSQVFRPKPSELREMNFWSPTSM